MQSRKINREKIKYLFTINASENIFLTMIDNVKHNESKIYSIM